MNRVYRGHQLFDRRNLFRLFTNQEFKQRFRLSKRKASVLIQYFEPRLKAQRTGRRYISPALQVLIALRYYATGSHQRIVAECLGVSQPTVCRVIQRVSRLIARLKPKFIFMPVQREHGFIKREFQQMGDFPSVLGCIDCTHIPIKKPSENAANFYCRKGFYSLNVQLVTDSRLRIRNVVCRWGGSTHDSRIFENSSLQDYCENGHLNGCLLGDQGYPCRPYLLTPFMRPATEPEERYNASHIRTRNSIERAIGVMKSQFRVLSHDSKLRLKLEHSTIVVISVCILRNISINSTQDFVRKLQNNNVCANNFYNVNNLTGNRIRQQVVQDIFT